MLTKYLLIALCALLFIAAVYLIYWLLDKRGGEKRTIGILKNLCIFRGTMGPNNTFKN